MIRAEKQKLADYFVGNSQFFVPFFQRSYVWDTENWTTFWEHVEDVLKRSESKVQAEHFIGTIIIKQKEGTRLGELSYDLIDGQQRLMTVALFLKAIGDASSGTMTGLKEMISGHLNFQDAQRRGYPRIVPSSYDAPHFDAVISGKELRA